MQRVPLVIMLLAGAVLLVGLILLGVTRTSIPVHVHAELTRLGFKLSETPSREEWYLLRNVNIESITLADCREIELVGHFYDLGTSRPIRGLRKVRLVPDDPMSAISFGGMLQLQELIVGPQARVDVTRGIGLQITESGSSVTISVEDSVEVVWEHCGVEPGDSVLPKGLEGRTGRFGFRPSIESGHLAARGAQGLLNINIELPAGTSCLFEVELPVTELNFVQQPLGSSQPDLTTTIRSATITFPTLPDEKPISLPEGSYLKIDNLHDFTLKRVQVDPSGGYVVATLYGYTNDLKAAYGRGKLRQLLPASLLLLRQNATLVVVAGLMLWFLKTCLDLYDRWRKWKGGVK